MDNTRESKPQLDISPRIHVQASEAIDGSGTWLTKHLRLSLIWFSASMLSMILLVAIYTAFIGRDRAFLNKEIYEDHFLINAPHTAQLYIWEGYAVTTYGENGLVVDKEVNFDIPRVLFLGDSYVEAKQVSDPDKFTEIFERTWNEDHPDQPLQSLNLGAAGLDMRPYLSFGRNTDRAFSPDLVFVLLNQQDFQPLIRDADLLAKYKKDSTLKLVQPERLNQFQRLLSDSPFRQFFIRIQLQTQGFLKRSETTQDKELEEQSRGRRDRLAGHEESVAAQLKELKAIWGSRLVIVYNAEVPSYGQGASTSYEPDTLMREAKKQDIPVLDLYEPMLASYLAKQPPRGFNNTTLGKGHFNKTGHRIIARELVSYLEDSDLK